MHFLVFSLDRETGFFDRDRDRDSDHDRDRKESEEMRVKTVFQIKPKKQLL